MRLAEGERPRPLALTMGEPAGIGPEIAIKAWLRRREGIAPFFVIADPGHIDRLARRLGAAAPVAVIDDPGAATRAFVDSLPVLPIALPAPVEPGRPDPANAKPVIEAIARAVALVQAGQAAAVVTNPIQKSTLYDAGFRYPGHTEFLAHLAGPAFVPVMMLACPELKVVLASVHLPLRAAIEQLTTERIVEVGRIAANALRQDFAIARPRLALAGLNPHAGEAGSLGREEIEIIAPAALLLRAANIAASDPQPADTLFHPHARARYDAVLCMYHDQALIPLKTIDFERGVNITLGLPFVRTSPDHGTALALAGRGVASEASLVEALRLAAAMAKARAG